MEPALSAPLNIGFDYTRSLGPVLSRFVTGLTERRIVGTRGSDGRVHAPPAEYDPITHAPLTDLVDVSTVGVVVTWTWVPRPLEGQPLTRPFAFALIRLDGADTPMLHAVDSGSDELMRTGMRVRARWCATPVGSIRDIECFEPTDGRVATPPPPRSVEAPPTGTADATATTAAERVTMVTTPVHLRYRHTASPEESRYLRGLATGRLLGQRCPACGRVYIPPRGACPTDGVPTTDEVELPDQGTVTTFCVVNVPFAGQRVAPPYVVAQVLLDGADIPLPHLVLGGPAGDVRMGMRVAAVWRPRDQWSTSPENIDHFRPTGEPDAPYESYAHHL
ncbi:OB-fold domain-containing protein [Micromonospora sp. WMMA1363]|uniref:OB-fold domain-containing protein n=1 Tax=Micromonospora sp. WMMA1363 TaxID=3053985 RepID=UPI00259C9341|nr:OB-fold nucleic acid binding domain-containing protein [Micromonospora sp. WMMA1363]MDM4719399.1 OB-fold domain-containing protein [Micromonospora sp. WMMA1363]